MYVCTIRIYVNILLGVFMNEWVAIRLDKKRWELVTAASETLDSCMMARFDKRSGNLGVTDLGRIASHYYIKHGMQIHTLHTYVFFLTTMDSHVFIYVGMHICM